MLYFCARHFFLFVLFQVESCQLRLNSSLFFSQLIFMSVLLLLLLITIDPHGDNHTVPHVNFLLSSRLFVSLELTNFLLWLRDLFDLHNWLHWFLLNHKWLTLYAQCLLLKSRLIVEFLRQGCHSIQGCWLKCTFVVVLIVRVLHLIKRDYSLLWQVYILNLSTSSTC